MGFASMLSQILDGGALSRLETAGDIVLAVDGTTGSDAETPTRPAVVTSGDHTARPFATIAGALAALRGLVVNHNVRIDVAAGNYAGAAAAGFSFGPGSAASSAQLVVKGTMGLATLTTGPNSGTFTSGSAGTTGTVTWGTATLTGAGWTVNNLRGKWVRLPVSGQALVVHSNTTDTITVCGAFSGSPSGAAFEIIEPTTNVNTLVTFPDSYEGDNTATAHFLVSLGQPPGVNNNLISAQCVFENLKLSGANRGFHVFGPSPVLIRRCSFALTSASGSPIRCNSDGVTTIVRECYALMPAAAFTTTNARHRLELSRSAVDGGTRVAQAVQNGADIRATDCSFKTQTSGMFSMSEGPWTLLLSGCICEGNGGSTTGVVAAGAGMFNGGNVQVNGSSLSGYGTALTLTNGMQCSLSSVSGSSNTTAVSLAKGARCQLASTVTLTGTTELNVDGTTDTIANMRAASPKHMKNSNYFTVVYE
jgi:hypothetical protein